MARKVARELPDPGLRTERSGTGAPMSPDVARALALLPDSSEEALQWRARSPAELSRRRGRPAHRSSASGRIGKFVCIGLNYADHAAEIGRADPEGAGRVFMKARRAPSVGRNDDGRDLPQGSVKTDWEVELGVVIGSNARYVSEEPRAGPRRRLLRRQRRVGARIPDRARRHSGTRARAATPSARSAPGW